MARLTVSTNRAGMHVNSQPGPQSTNVKYPAHVNIGSGGKIVGKGSHSLRYANRGVQARVHKGG